MGPVDRFDHRAKHVLALAQDEAIRFNHTYIGPEHLLLGLVRERVGVAAQVLGSFGLEVEKLRANLEAVVGRGGPGTTASEIVLTPRTKMVIEFANDEAQRLGHRDVGTEHVLLGLVRDPGSVASVILGSFGAPLEKVRERVLVKLDERRSA